MCSIHEEGGAHQQGKVFPGLKKSEVTGLLPDLLVGEEQPIDESGWFKQDHVET